jgi:hypothetical protein
MGNLLSNPVRENLQIDEHCSPSESLIFMVVPNMMEETNSKYRICPFLGQRTDPETALSYPSPLNCCTHARPISAVEWGHQEEFCLASKYPNCEVYNAKPGVPLPAGLQKRSKRKLQKKRSGKNWVWGIILLGFVIIGVWQLITREEGFRLLVVKPTMTMVLPVLNPAISTTVLPPSKSPTITLTTGITPVDTATPRPLLELDTPLGIDHRFIIVQVLVGDSLERIANKHGTTVVALQAINYRIPSPLVPGWALVIPIDSVDMQELPSFEVYPVAEEISMKALAVLLSVDLNEFKYYNDLDDGFIPQPGDWLLVPRVEPIISLSAPAPTP